MGKLCKNLHIYVDLDPETFISYAYSNSDSSVICHIKTLLVFRVSQHYQDTKISNMGPGKLIALLQGAPQCPSAPARADFCVVLSPAVSLHYL